MAMSIMNNSAAAMTLGELNKNIRRVGKQIAKLSSGQKLNSAGDDASGYAISEKMRVQLRGLDQDIENVQTGSSLLKVAAGGIDDIVSELRSLKELSINAANDHNSDLDRETLQKEFEQRKADIEDIASTTNYNGKILLDGRYGNNSFSRVIEEEEEEERPRISDKYPEPFTEEKTGVTEPTAPVTNVSAGDYNITSDGVYVLQAGYKGKISIADGAKNVEIRQADSATLNDVYIDGPASGKANLWLDGLNIANNQDKSFILFHGNDNVLSLKGDNSIVATQATQTPKKAIINIGGGLTVEGTGSLKIEKAYNPYGAYIGTDSDEKGQADLTINSGTFYMRAGTPYGGGGMGAMIGAGSAASMGNITINGGDFDLYNTGGSACIGSGSQGSKAGNLTIKNATIKAVTDDAACIGSGHGGGIIGNIAIENSNIDVQDKVVFVMSKESDIINGGDGAGIGSGGSGSSAGDITVKNSVISAISNWGAGIGTGYSSSAGNIKVTDVIGRISSARGENIGKGYNGTITSKYVDPPIPDSGDAKDMIKKRSKVLIEGKGEPLIIHTGTKANQNLHVFINDMRPAALGIDAAAVTTRDKATKSLKVLDDALDYALGEATTVGSYISRLDYTKENLTTANENTQASESTIRDADMAKEMTGYTKSNILAQAAQSMLAQANHNTADVLNLLQS